MIIYILLEHNPVVQSVDTACSYDSLKTVSAYVTKRLTRDIYDASF
jgi:hypothetical protein